MAASSGALSDGGSSDGTLDSIQNIMHIQEKKGPIEGDDGAAQPFDEAGEPIPPVTNSNEWHYEIRYDQLRMSDGKQIKASSRVIKLKPEEMVQIIKLIEYAMPAVCGWHVMYNQRVVNQS